MHRLLSHVYEASMATNFYHDIVSGRFPQRLAADIVFDHSGVYIPDAR